MAYPYTANQDLTSAELNTDFAARPTATEVATLTNKTISGGTLSGTTTLPGGGQITSAGLLGICGTAAASVDVQGDISRTAWTSNGVQFRTRAATFTDTSSSGTVSNNAVNVFAVPTIAASSATTYTVASTVRISAAPTAGTNVTITNAYALNIVGGGLRVVGGVALIGTTFASLPSAPEAGTIAYITNSNTATWRATAAAGGANKVLVWWDGSNWLVFG